MSDPKYVLVAAMGVSGAALWLRSFIQSEAMTVRRSGHSYNYYEQVNAEYPYRTKTFEVEKNPFWKQTYNGDVDSLSKLDETNENL